MERVRVDKWLWAARFFKTRSLATDAVNGGRVQVDGVRVKPAREVRIGETVAVTVGRATTIVAVVRGIADKRGSAAQAAVLLPRLGSIVLVWPVALAGIWAAGWAVTTSAGIQVDEQFTVFGSSGALVVTLLTACLPVFLNHTEKSSS